jgi:uncharacterized OB-fold protein
MAAGHDEVRFSRKGRVSRHTAPVSWNEIVAAGCTACGRNHLAARALSGGTVEVMEGDATSPIRWSGEPRVYRVDCAECGAILFAREDCPLCEARGNLTKVLSAQNGIPAPKSCPSCGFNELVLTVEARVRVELTHGRVSRKVAEAEPHEGGFHVVEARCQSCEEVVAKAGDAKCVACGRSRLLRRMI